MQVQTRQNVSIGEGSGHKVYILGQATGPGVVAQPKRESVFRCVCFLFCFDFLSYWCFLVYLSVLTSNFKFFPFILRVRERTWNWTNRELGRIWEGLR